MELSVIIGCEGILGQQIVNAKLMKPEVIVVGYDKSSTSNIHHARFNYVGGNVESRSDLLRLKSEIDKIQSEFELGKSLSSIINAFAAKDFKYNPEILPPELPESDWMLWGWQNYPDQDFINQFNTNVIGLHRVLTTLYGCYKDSPSCSIVTFSSQFAKRNLDQELFKQLGHFIFKPPAYSASKAALENYTEYLSQVFKGSGIRINSIAPGVVDTGQSDEFKEKYSKTTNSGRLMSSDEIVGAIEFLTSESSAYMNGSCITIDGGWSAR
jgi:NAD(P)-dependent dehydrogenase (short-subunit alcohol dehydrogenase family)